MPRQPRTLLEHLVAAHGIRKGYRVATFIVSWSIASSALERELTIQDYMEWWHESQSTAYRHLSEFRDVFGHDADPQALVSSLAAEHGERLSRQGVGALSAVPWSAAHVAV